MAKIPFRNFTSKDCLLDATDIVNNSGKEKWVYSGYAIAFDGKGASIFGTDYAKNVLTFGVDNSSSSHADNCKNNFLVLGKGGIFVINGSFGQKKCLVLILVKQTQNVP